MSRILPSALSALALLLVPAAFAAETPSPAEAKLRESLRTTMLQVRTIQGERDALQAEKTQLETDKKALADKSEALAKRLVADKDASDKTIGLLTDKSSAQATEITNLNTTLEKWKVSHAQAVELAKTKEAARASAAQQVIELKRKVTDQQARNLALHRIAKDILSRYEKFGLGTALAAREPFTGNMRVKLENLVQDLGDQADAQQIKPDPAPSKVR